MAKKNKDEKALYQAARELFLASQSDAFTPQMLENFSRNSGYSTKEILDYMGSEAFQDQIYSESLGRNIDRAVNDVRENQAYADAFMNLELAGLSGGFGGGGVIPPGSDTEQARRASREIDKNKPQRFGADINSTATVPLPSSPQAEPAPQATPAPVLTNTNNPSAPAVGYGVPSFSWRDLMSFGRDVLYPTIKDVGRQIVTPTPYGQEPEYLTSLKSLVNAGRDRIQDKAEPLAQSTLMPQVTSPMAGVGGPSSSPAAAPAQATQPSVSRSTPATGEYYEYYLGGTKPSATQDQGLQRIQEHLIENAPETTPNEYINARQQAIREAMQSGTPMTISGDRPGIVMIGSQPTMGVSQISSAPIDGRGGFDPATARVAKAYNERINQMVAEGKTPTREEQVALQRGLVQQERDAQASFEDRFERARAAGLAAGGGAGDPLMNRIKYEQALAQMGILSPSESLREQRADRAVARREALTIPEKDRKAAQDAQEKADKQVFDTQRNRIVRDTAKAVEDAITGVLAGAGVDKVADLPPDQKAIIDSYQKYINSPVMQEIFDSVSRLKVAADKGDKNASAQYQEFVRGISGSPQEVLGFLFDSSIDPETGKPRGIYFQY